MIEKALQRAEINLSRETWRETTQVCQTVLARDRNHVGALELLAKAQWKGGQAAALIGTLTQLISLNPYEPGYHALKGAAHQSLGDFEIALACYGRAGGCGDVTALSVELADAQDRLVRQLAREDHIFRIRYSRDPADACRRAGLTHAAEAHRRPMFKLTAPAFRGSFTRPS